MYHGHGFLGFGWVIGIIVVVALIVVFASIYNSSKPDDSMLEILKRKYASGEISREEYLRRKKDIEEQT
jgi:putative membrane protein